MRYFVIKDKTQFGKDIASMIMGIYKSITGKDLGNAINHSTYYQVPDMQHIWYYMVGEEQSLTQTMVHNNIMPFDTLWGERNIINWYIQLCAEMPENMSVFLMLISGITKSKEYGSNVYLEFKDVSINAIKSARIGDENRKMLQKKLDKIYGTY